MKDETYGIVIIECPAIIPKTYTYNVQKDYHKIRIWVYKGNKGVKKSASKELTFTDCNLGFKGSVWNL